MQTVLIVDDDELVRSSLVNELKRVGIETKSAKDGEEGFTIASKIKPTLIVLDENMPKMTGQQFIEKLRKQEWGKDIMVIAFTVNDDINLMNQKLKSGVTEYLDKTTVSPQQVVTIIQQHLS